MTRLAAPSEHAIQRAICEYLRWRRYVVIRQNSGAIRQEYQGRTRLVRFGNLYDQTMSIVDLQAISPEGKVWWIEVKRPGWKPNGNPRSAEAQRWKRQQRFLEEMRARGHGGMVAYSIEDVIQAIEEGE